MADTRDKPEQHDRPFNPFSLMRQGIDEMDRWFSRMTGERTGMPWTAARSARAWTSSVTDPQGDWAPAIEAFQRGNEFVVRADVPGLKRSDIIVEAGDDALTIRGERRQEHSDERDGTFWTERSYGSFYRVVPLPPGAMADSAKASFSNGVLEIVMPTPPPEARRGRRIDISGTVPSDAEKK